MCITHDLCVQGLCLSCCQGAPGLWSPAHRSHEAWVPAAPYLINMSQYIAPEGCIIAKNHSFLNDGPAIVIGRDCTKPVQNCVFSAYLDITDGLRINRICDVGASTNARYSCTLRWRVQESWSLRVSAVFSS